jgi:hypothetical protein
MFFDMLHDVQKTGGMCCVPNLAGGQESELQEMVKSLSETGK